MKDTDSNHANSGIATPATRRDFLKSAAAGIAVAGAGLVAATDWHMAKPERVLAQSALSPDAALRELMDGNRRFVDGKGIAHQQDLRILRQHLAEKQEPFAAVLSCADSRVPIEILFDQSIGHVFVTRVAGNMVTPEIIASLEYGVAVLGTKVVMVLGHSGCGAIKAAIAGKSVPGQISSLYPPLRAAVDHAGPNVKATTEANAKIQAKLLSQASTVIAEKIKEGTIKVVAGYYDIGTGSVTVLD